jgi:hypothetical protein
MNNQRKNSKKGRKNSHSDIPIESKNEVKNSRKRSDTTATPVDDGNEQIKRSEVLAGFHDLQTINPGLSAEFDYEKNAPLKPNEINAGSNRVVWWKCSMGHSWKATVDSRNRGAGCPDCQTSNK